MWKIKTFETRQDLLDFVGKNYGKIQYQEIFVNNGYAVEYRKLKVI